MPLANYTTTVSALKSIAEIHALLAAFGARSISNHYDCGKIAAIEFVVTLDGHPLSIRLPQNSEAAQKVMDRQRMRYKGKKSEHAENVSWRILKDWVRAQLALVELEQVEIQQVFMPYALIGAEPLYKQFRAQRSEQLALAAGRS